MNTTRVRIDASVDLSEHGLILTCDDTWIEEDDSLVLQCGSIVHSDNENIVQCPCGEWVFNDDDTIHEYGGESSFCCGDCAEGAGLYLWDDDTWRNTPQDSLTAYHCGDRCLHDADPRRPWRIGFEIEKEDLSGRKILASGFRLPDGWIAESDSSLDEDSGFELISPAYNLDEFELFCDDVGKMSHLIDGNTTLDCGGHITVSYHAMNDLQLSTRLRAAFPLIMALWPDRVNNRFVSGAVTKRECKHRDKYSAFRFRNYGIEIRLPNAVKSVGQLKWRWRVMSHFMVHDRAINATYLDMGNSSSDLHTLLREVYSEDRIAEKRRLYGAFARLFNQSMLSQTIAGYVSDPGRFIRVS